MKISAIYSPEKRPSHLGEGPDSCQEKARSGPEERPCRRKEKRKRQEELSQKGGQGVSHMWNAMRSMKWFEGRSSRMRPRTET